MNSSFGAYDYPAIGTIEADGTNFIEKALGKGKTARQVTLTVYNHKNATVLFNGKKCGPDRLLGNIGDYFLRYFGTAITPNGTKKYGGIESVVVKGEGVTFSAKIST